MAGSATSVAVGLGITLGILALLAIILLIAGLCTSKNRERDLEEEMARRRSLLREQHVNEQEQWRERRLRDVVLILVESGEVEEGVPIAFQLPGRNEVLARRKLRGNNNNNRMNATEDIDAITMHMTPEHAAEARAILKKSLDALLANGRPADADAAPDIMQLLLDEQEGRHAWTFSSDGEDDDNSNFTSELSTPLGADGSSSDTNNANNNNNNNNNGAAAALRRNSMPSHLLSDETATMQESATSLYDQLNPANRHRTDRLIQKLRNERNPKRRRKDASEVYGKGYDYLLNPNNKPFVLTGSESPLLYNMSIPASTNQSLLVRFLSPLTPFRGGKRKFRPATNNNNNSSFNNNNSNSFHYNNNNMRMPSAFENRMPEDAASSRFNNQSHSFYNNNNDTGTVHYLSGNNNNNNNNNSYHTDAGGSQGGNTGGVAPF